MGNKKYHLAQFGAFDVESYGDVLFPVALHHAMKSRIDCNIDLYAKTAKTAMYGSQTPVYAFEDFAENQARNPYDGIIVGGGELLHFVPIEFSAEQKTTAEGELWLTPLGYAKQYGIPAFVNCVGVPYDMNPAQEQKMGAALENVAMVSVRDRFSFERLTGVVKDRERLVCVADQMCDMNRLYQPQQLEEAKKRLTQQGLILDQPYIVAQYGTENNCAEMAEQLAVVFQKTGMPVYLLAINHCHEDQTAIQRICTHSNIHFVTVSADLQPVEIMAVIAHAKAFVGTSLHGNLTAASFGVPFVGVDMYPSFVSKMDGLFSMLGCEQYLVPSAQGVAGALLRRMKDEKMQQTVAAKLAECQTALNLYYDNMAQKLKG